MKGPRGRVGKNRHPTLAHEGFAAVQVEEISETHAHDEDWIHDRVDVVGTQVGQPEDAYVCLPLDVHQLLAIDDCCGGRVHGFALPSVDAGHGVRRLDGLEDR